MQRPVERPSWPGPGDVDREHDEVLAPEFAPCDLRRFAIKVAVAASAFVAVVAVALISVACGVWGRFEGVCLR